MEKVILVTGANGGVGHFISKFLLRQGYRNICFHYRNASENIQQLCLEYDLPFSKYAYACDLTEEIEVQNMVIEITKSLGPIAYLVNVAGASTNSMSWKMSKRDFMYIFEANVLSAFLCSKAVIPKMREMQFGRIINFSSIVGVTGVVGAAHYSAAKAALIGLTKSMALELASKKITVNAIALGYFNTGLIESIPENIRDEIREEIPMNRFGEEEDIGAAIRYLISDEASFLTGQTIHLNGGQF